MPDFSMMPEAFVSSAKIATAVSREVKAGRLRKLGSRLYTRNLKDPPENIVHRNLWPLVAAYLPGGLIADRTALENRPAPDGSVFLIADHKRNIAMPGVTVRPRRGAPPLESDRPFVGGLRIASPARAFLENMRPSRAREGVARTLSRGEIEERLDEMLRHAGEPAIQRLRDEARAVASQLGLADEFQRLDALIGTLLGTRHAAVESPVAVARAAGLPYDPQRLDLFQRLFTELAGTAPMTRNDRLRTNLDLQQPNSSDWTESYAYDTVARMRGITSPAGPFTYTYNSGVGGIISASSLITNIALPNLAAITNAFDENARMTATVLLNSGGTNLGSYIYTYNVDNQRTQVTRTGENYANYTYDAIGQVIGDQAYEVSGNTARLNEQLRYGFDPAGNLNNRTNNTLVENFAVNSLNELTSNANSGTLTVMGTTTPSATSVAVNGTNAQRYNDATFAATNLPLTTTYTAVASDTNGYSVSNTVTVSIATNKTFQYDGNGNLTNDGLRNFVYDDENQLIQVSVSNQWMSKFAYDGKMRRRIRQESTWQIGAWAQTNEIHYIYDGNLVIQERDAGNQPIVTYTRGLDLSGSLEGAGGIGGLLAWTALDYATIPLGQNYYHSDGNGNITMMINTNQNIVAKYLYDAFGNMISKSGLFAPANHIRFSSKEFDPNPGLIYYLYRYYDPNLQRWQNRDPIGEFGGLNLYSFVNNDPVIWIDRFGLAVVGTPVQIPPGGQSIVCRGGKLVVQNNNKGPDSKCSQAHEEQHINDWKKRYGDDLCKGVKDGYLPVGGDGYAEFLRQSECDAYKAGKKCRDDLLKGCNAKDQAAIQAGIDRDNEQLKEHGCK